MNCISTGDQLYLIQNQNLLLVPQVQNPLVQCLFTKENKQYLISGGTDKALRCWEVLTMKLLFELGLPKKIKKLVQANDKFYVSDKHGDIFDISIESLCSPDFIQLKKKETEALQTNLATPKCFTYIRNTLVLGDSYSKIKIFNEKNTDEIIQIWIPFEGYLKQFLSMGEGYLLLFKKNGEDELKYYEFYYMGGNNYPADEPSLTLLFPQGKVQEYLSKNSDTMRLLINQNKIFLICQVDKDLDIYKVDISNPKDVKLAQIAKIPNAQMIDVIFHDGLVISYLNVNATEENEENKLQPNKSIRIKNDKFVYFVPV